MSITATADASAAATRHGRPAGFGHLLLSEWTKIRSVRSTTWTIIAFVIVTIGFAALITWVTEANWTGPRAAERNAQAIADPTAIIFGVAVYLGQLTLSVLGVLVITTEYSTGVIRASLLAVPKRVPMLLAKIVVFAIMVGILAEIVAFGSFFVGSAILHSRVSVSLSDPGILRATIGAGLYLTAFGLFAMGLGTLIRHTAGAISVAVGVAFVLPIISGLLPDTAFWNHLVGYLPVQAGGLIFLVHETSSQTVLSPWEGFGVLCAWAALLLGIGAYLLQRRDA
ncbi:MAG TPA: ABC transporter permease subunit [Streptosporangiaceae bacterium]|jgi:ABC-type transport system involved in multi-copper enzyme maturation permease subunit